MYHYQDHKFQSQPETCVRGTSKWTGQGLNEQLFSTLQNKIDRLMLIIVEYMMLHTTPSPPLSFNL